MQNPQMIVLGLLSIGLRYGFEMEKFAQETELRRWAAIGASTIYKTLKDLEREGAINAKKEKGGPGPARLSYKLTASGRRRFRSLVMEAMASDASVYSDRIAGLVFLPAAPRADALASLEKCDAGLEEADAILAAHAERFSSDPIADAVIGFYRDVHQAERKALTKVRKAISTH